MAKIFISYSREDIDIVKKIEQSLKKLGHLSWRDQENIYAGQNWPKAIGEAIADNDFLLLIWSKHAKISDFVEFEWSTAFALRKQIIPIFLDKTPLPPLLSAVNGIQFKNIDDDFPKIVKALERSAPEIDKKQVSNILGQFDNIKHSEPEQVIKVVKKTIEQKASNVQGSVYQAGGDIHITTFEKLFKKWQIWIVLVAITILLFGVFLDLPEKVNKFMDSIPELSNKCIFSGRVLDLKGKPVEGVEVIVLGGKGSGDTDSNGEFNFEVKERAGEIVEILIKKDGIERHRSRETLPEAVIQLKERINDE